MQSHLSNLRSEEDDRDEATSDFWDTSSFVFDDSTPATTHFGSDGVLSRSAELDPADGVGLTAPATPTPQQRRGSRTQDAGIDTIWPFSQSVDQLQTSDYRHSTSEAYRRRLFQRSLYYDQSAPTAVNNHQPSDSAVETVDPRTISLTQSGLANTYHPSDPAVEAVEPELVTLTTNELDETLAGFPLERYVSDTFDVNLAEAFTLSAALPTGPDRDWASLYRLGLPASIYDYGFQPEDFDPTTKFPSNTPNPASFRPFPPDLSDEHIFKPNPKHIAYDNLLRLAVKYTNPQIKEKVNEGRPEKAFSSDSTVANRVKAALTWKAAREQPVGGAEALQEWLNQERAKNGVGTRTRIRGKKRSPEIDGSVEKQSKRVKCKQ